MHLFKIGSVTYDLMLIQSAWITTYQTISLPILKYCYIIYTQLYQIVSSGKELFSIKKSVVIMHNLHWLKMIASDIFIESLLTFNKNICLRTGTIFVRTHHQGSQTSGLRGDAITWKHLWMNRWTYRCTHGRQMGVPDREVFLLRKKINFSGKNCYFQHHRSL